MPPAYLTTHQSITTEIGYDEMSTKFGKYIKRLRKDSGLTLRDVERLTGISNPYICQLENGKRGIPGVHTLEKLSIAYHVSIARLLTEAGIKIYNTKRRGRR